MTPLGLRVEAPLVTLRNPHAREFAKSFAAPPPATVYGMLLSMVGERHRHAHAGARLALAMLTEPEPSVVLRTVWRIKFNRDEVGPGHASNRRMDYQEVLSDLRFAVWVDSAGEQAAGPTLTERLIEALDDPAAVRRYGGLSLGESRDLVNVIERLSPRPDEAARWLLPDPSGALVLPLWPDHVAGARTRWGCFRVEPGALCATPAREMFSTIEPPTP